ncbi:MAG: ImmA/IrrE family metallo-endopeptidase, partial [Clostridia bacterium]|nr:ImmA/IrrE family metallo-endopeptidase [Clostridia bacterium]
EINNGKEVFGYTLFDNNTNQFIIYYDDINAGINKQRFSIAHEIGHIVLQHGANGNRYSELFEEEADYFAGYLMCPECLANNEEIYQYMVNSSFKMPSLFGIADDTAMIKLGHFTNRHSLSKSRRYDYEKIIMECLEGAVLTKIRN